MMYFAINFFSIDNIIFIVFNNTVIILFIFLTIFKFLVFRHFGHIISPKYILFTI